MRKACRADDVIRHLSIRATFPKRRECKTVLGLFSLQFSSVVLDPTAAFVSKLPPAVGRKFVTLKRSLVGS
ncbi:hypothetical protein F2P79_016847 [Pimephales promelas]|nr:hypothetical protein F2P79_016847 [Pimephales promelas]